jgi:F-type H+-transporting ATPase subunit b
MDALGINVNGLIAQVVNFTLLLALLYLLLYKPVLRVLDERRTRIQKSLEDAEAIRQQAARAQEEYERQVAEARQRGREVIAEATLAADRERQRILAEANEQARQIVARAQEEINFERKRLEADLHKQAVDLSIAATRRVLGFALDEQAQRRLIESFLSETRDLN